MSRYHPELGRDEVFVGNTHHPSVPSYLAALQTARIGEIAYDIHGKALPRDYMRPLFVGWSEIERYDAIMTARGRRSGAVAR